MKPLMIGDPMWTPSDWLKIFKNLVKVGLSYNIGITFLSLSKGFENMRAYEILLRIQEEVTPSLIFSLKIEKWQISALDILSFFVLQGPVNAILIQKIVSKLFNVAKEICKGNFSQFSSDLISFLYHLKAKYAQSSFAEDIEQEYSRFMEECQVDPIQINMQRYSIVPWTVFEMQHVATKVGKAKYRGLVNLGNSKQSSSLFLIK